MDNQEYDNWTDEYFDEYDEPETDDFHDRECFECGSTDFDESSIGELVEFVCIRCGATYREYCDFD